MHPKIFTGSHALFIRIFLKSVGRDLIQRFFARRRCCGETDFPRLLAIRMDTVGEVITNGNRTKWLRFEKIEKRLHPPKCDEGDLWRY